MTKVFALWVCCSCLLVPVFTQAEDADDCDEAACRNNPPQFDLLQVRQTLQSKAVDTISTPSMAEGACVDLSGWQQGGSTNTCGDYCDHWCDGDSYTSSHIPDNNYLVFATDACCCCGGGDEYAQTHVCKSEGQLYADITHPDTYVAWWSSWDGTWPCSKFGTCKCSGSTVVSALPCHDAPSVWWSSTGATCYYYYWANWCTSSGGYGSEWDYGVFDDWADKDGTDASEACCACGGGSTATLSPTPAPPPTPAAPPTPSDICGEVDGPCTDCVVASNPMCAWMFDFVCKQKCCEADACADACTGTSECPACYDWPFPDVDPHATMHTWWKDSRGLSCGDYSHFNWCTASGGYGGGWGVESWGTFADWADNRGIAADEACCMCGGGSPKWPKPGVEQCADDDRWHQVGYPRRTCAWIGLDPSRCSSSIESPQGLKAWEGCPEACGLCDLPKPCVDNKKWHAGGKPTHDCSWVLQTMVENKHTCDLACSEGEKPVYAWQACPLACGSCPWSPEAPTKAPKPAGPTAAPTTSEPTPAPTLCPDPIPDTILTTNTAPVEAGAIQLDVESQSIFGIGDSITIRWQDILCETRTIVSFGTITLDSPLIHSYPTGADVYLSVYATTTPADPTPAPTDGASVMDDPHVRNLAGEVFDINKPGEHVMFRLPRDVAQRPLIELRAVMSASEESFCGLYVKSATLTGDWLDGQVVDVRALKRNLPGDNTAGNTTVWPFALKVSPASAADVDYWRPFAQFTTVGVGAFETNFEALTDKVTVGALKREEFGNLVESQAFAFHFGPDKLPVKMATLIVSQASHQALGIELARVSQLGWPAQEIGGLLGSDTRDTAIEEFTYECKEAKASKPLQENLRESREVVKPLVKATWL